MGGTPHSDYISLERYHYGGAVSQCAWSALFCRLESLKTDCIRKFWFSDIIVMWRAMVVWEWNRRVTVPCAILIVVPVRCPIPKT